jgi:hypothetical protein
MVLLEFCAVFLLQGLLGKSSGAVRGTRSAFLPQIEGNAVLPEPSKLEVRTSILRKCSDILHINFETPILK